MERKTKEQQERKCIAEVMKYFETHKLNWDNKVHWSQWRNIEDGILNLKFTLDGKKYTLKQYDINDIIILRKNIEEIFKLEIEELRYGEYENSKINLEFTDKIDEKKAAMYEKKTKIKNPKITLAEKFAYKGLESDDVSERLLACKQLFQILFHEIQHHRQYMMTQLYVSSKDALMYAKEFGLKVVLEDVFYSSDEDRGNYDAFSIENNADSVGWNTYINIMQDNSEFLNDLADLYKARHYTYKYFVDVYTRDGKKHFKYEESQERNDIATEILDATITEEIIEEYPILKKEYNIDGTKKYAAELIINLNNEIKQISEMQELEDSEKETLIEDAKEMYFELIYKEIEKRPEQSIGELQKTIGEQELIVILRNINMYFSRECSKKVNQRKIMCELEKKNSINAFQQEIDEYYQELIDDTNEYYNKRKKFLNELESKIYEITPESIQTDTLCANLGKNEIDSVIIEIKQTQMALKLKENTKEERGRI